MARRWYLDLWHADADDQEYEEARSSVNRAVKAKELALKYAREESPPLETSAQSVAEPVASSEQDDDLFGWEGPVTFNRRSKKAKLAPAETEQQKKLRAAKGWHRVIMHSPACSKAGRRAAKLELVQEQVDVIDCYLALKAGNTGVQRLAPVALMMKWSISSYKGWPPGEDEIVEYASTLEATRARSAVDLLLQSLKFMAGTFQFGRSVLEAADSNYLAGRAMRAIQLMPKVKKAKSLELQFVCRLEYFFMHTVRDPEKKMVAGGLLTLIYYRARINDADVILSIEFYEERTVMQVQDTKTSEVRQVVHLTASTESLTGEDWQAELFHWRTEQNAPMEDGWPVFPSRVDGVWIKAQASGDDVNAFFWAIQVDLYPMEVPQIRFTSHSCKHTLLNAAAIFGILLETRQTLGYHKNQKFRSVETYSEHLMIQPIKEISRMIVAFREGRFDPDGKRRPIKRTLVAAVASELSKPEVESSSESEGDEGEPTAEVQHKVDISIAEACQNEVELADKVLVNISNGRIHRLMKNDPLLTGCGNPTGSNIVPLASGIQVEDTPAELICKTCFGRDVEKRRVIARRLSEPTEHLVKSL